MTRNCIEQYLTEATLSAYLAQRYPARGEFTVGRLSGGVSSLVFLCESAGGDRWVVKQAREFLDVADDWPASRERIFVECEAMRALSPILTKAMVPFVHFLDRELHAYAMDAVHPRAALFKQALLSGSWEARWFTSCGEVLAQLHSETAAREADFREALASQEHFQTLRIQPYFEHAAKSHRDLSQYFNVATYLATTNSRCLVHGDFSPKNIFINPTSAKPVLLDFEVAHWGNPAFDVGFFLTHPLAKAIHQPANALRLAQGVREFSDAYFSNCGPFGALVEESLIQWGAIALARVDGKSPLEYLKDRNEQEALRAMGRKLIRGTFRSIDEVAAVIASGAIGR